MAALKKGDRGTHIGALQRRLASRGYDVAVNGDFDADTQKAVRAFQSQNLDPRGHPLVVDGQVGPLTRWSLENPKPFLQPASPVDYSALPASGGSKRGRAALARAIGELKSGAGEVGGDNQGPSVRKYVTPAGGAEGDSWCAGFVSYCFHRAVGGSPTSMPFAYTLGARDILRQFENKGWADKSMGTHPVPGDLVFWWRGAPRSWKGHVGFVHSVRDGILYTIEGNRSPRVQGFSYVLSRVEKLLGYGHVP